MKITIVATKDRRPGQPEPIGEIDGTGLVYGNGRGSLPSGPAYALIKLLGDGYGEREFHMDLGHVCLAHCHVVGMGAQLRFDYMREIESPRR